MSTLSLSIVNLGLNTSARLTLASVVCNVTFLARPSCDVATVLSTPTILVIMFVCFGSDTVTQPTSISFV